MLIGFINQQTELGGHHPVPSAKSQLPRYSSPGCQFWSPRQTDGNSANHTRCEVTHTHTHNLVNVLVFGEYVYIYICILCYIIYC